MRNINRFLFVVLLSCFGIMKAEATLYVEIAGGQASGLPIAIVPFKGETSDKMELANIIRADLQSSGQFKTTSMQELQQTPSQKSEVQYPYWQALKVEDMVVGSIQKTGSGYSVHFELLDVIREKSGASQAPLLSMRFDNIQANQLRALAHHISDLVFEKLMGIRGIFSTRIAYVSVSDTLKNPVRTLEVADSDGFNPKPLFRSSFPLMSPAWSPDGKKIAFVSFEKDRPSVNVVDVITGRLEKITQYPGINGAPAWSPNGRTLAVVLSKDGSPKIYTVDVVTKQLTKVTEGTGIDTEPSWSPDGGSIVFTSNRGGKPQVYRVLLASGKIERLTFIGDYNAKPSLTPDGKRLLMLHRDDNGLFSIAVQTLSSGDLKKLTQASLNDSPSLAPNGLMALYGSQEGGRGLLGAVSLDGRIKIRLPAHEGNVQEPAWSPFAAS